MARIEVEVLVLCSLLLVVDDVCRGNQDVGGNQEARRFPKPFLGFEGDHSSVLVEPVLHLDGWNFLKVRFNLGMVYIFAIILWVLGGIL